ncbi:hypothetical protein [Thermus oshimai]|uniref:hypothetical protein n=1 Tax=Thermus oshimai TaxID=56957 RepID=UPI0012DF2641|nr:hypothetical protein [Thermus oshimai]
MGKGRVYQREGRTDLLRQEVQAEVGAALDKAMRHFTAVAVLSALMALLVVGA